MAPRRLLALAFASIALVAAAGCGGSDEAEPAAPADGVSDIASVDQLRQAFAQADGSPRLLLLLSPT
jgi:hypothetical protein